MSAAYNNDWNTYSGSSFSACIVAWAVGLMYCIQPGLKPSEVCNVIIKTSDPIDHINEEYSSFFQSSGKLNIHSTVSELLDDITY